MKVPYGQENILITSDSNPVALSRSIYFFQRCEELISADMIVEFGSIQFRIDGGNPASGHCQYAVEYCTIGRQGDSITLENFFEIDGFRVVKAGTANAKISIIYYKEQ